MYKKPLEISCYVAGAGAFGVFFRWLQDQLAFDENGLNERSVFNLLVPAMVIASALVFRHFIRAMQDKRIAPPNDFCKALYNPGKLFTILRWVAGLVMIAGAVVLMMTTETDPNVNMIRVVCLLAALSGLAFPLVLGQANYDSFAHESVRGVAGAQLCAEPAQQRGVELRGGACDADDRDDGLFPRGLLCLPCGKAV